MERQKRAGGLKGKGQRIYYNPKKSGSCSTGPPGRSCGLKQKKKSLITHDPKGQKGRNKSTFSLHLDHLPILPIGQIRKIRWQEHRIGWRKKSTSE